MSPQRIILVADDDENIRNLVVLALRPLGFPIVQAATGREAIEKAEECRPALILLDILMPQGHGFTVCKELRSRTELDSTKILFLTGKAYAADRHQAMQLGADGFLNKPFNLGELRSTVTRLMKEQEGSDPCE